MYQSVRVVFASNRELVPLGEMSDPKISTSLWMRGKSKKEEKWGKGEEEGGGKEEMQERGGKREGVNFHEDQRERKKSQQLNSSLFPF